MKKRSVKTERATNQLLLPWRPMALSWERGRRVRGGLGHHRAMSRTDLEIVSLLAELNVRALPYTAIN